MIDGESARPTGQLKLGMGQTAGLWGKIITEFVWQRGESDREKEKDKRGGGGGRHKAV